MENIFGERVKILRNKHGYSMQGLANKLGVTKSSVNMWENGGSIPRPKTLIALAQTLNVSTDYLLKGGIEC